MGAAPVMAWQRDDARVMRPPLTPVPEPVRPPKPAAVTPGDVDAHYARVIEPAVEAFETFRKEAWGKAATRMLKWLPLVGGIGLAAFLFDTRMGLASDKSFSAALTIMLICTAVLGAIGWKPLSDYKEAAKDIVYPRMFRIFGPQFTYHHVPSLKISDLKADGLFPNFTNYSTEDHVRGHYRGVGIELMELKLKRLKSTGRSTSEKTVFHGIAVRLQMHKPFTTRTIVAKEKGRLVNWFSRPGCDDGVPMHRVRLEDPAFEAKFEVTSTDQAEARYLLTTSFMERLTGLQRSLGGTSVQASFDNHHLLLLIESEHDYFKAQPVWEKVCFRPQMDAIVAEMQSIFAIIDQLHLHDRSRI